MPGIVCSFSTTASICDAISSGSWKLSIHSWRNMAMPLAICGVTMLTKAVMGIVTAVRIMSSVPVTGSAL